MSKACGGFVIKVYLYIVA